MLIELFVILHYRNLHHIDVIKAMTFFIVNKNYQILTRVIDFVQLNCDGLNFKNGFNWVR